MRKARRVEGFSLMELVVVLGILGILAALAYPAFRSWSANAGYREQASELASQFRRLRDEAVTTGQPRPTTLVMGPRAIPGSNERLVLKHGPACNQPSDLDLTFFPNGSVSAEATVCIFDADGQERFQVAIPSAATGRVVVSD